MNDGGPPLASAGALPHFATMTAQPLRLAGASLLALASGALWWPEERLLCVADLHLGKSERLARRGGTLLPPYETAATLDRLAGEVARLAPAGVVCLGDSFDDPAAEAALAPADLGRLAGLMAGRRWVWVAGNHDPLPLALDGDHCAEVEIGPLTFRHAALHDARMGEVSGHFHPKLRLSVGGRTVARACFLHDDRRLILPAFGAYTGGLDAGSPALAALLGEGARAILSGDPCVAVPLGRALARRAGARA